MRQAFRADSALAANKAQYWTDVTSAVCVSANAIPADPLRFSGKLTNWDLGDLSLSHLLTDPIRYVREDRHLKSDKEERILITFSGDSDLTFVQDDMTLTCRKKQFFIEMPHRPYEFTQIASNDIWALRLSGSLLRWHVRSVEKFAPYTYDASRGIGALLFDMLRILPLRLSESSGSIDQTLGHTIVELVALALENNELVLGSHTNSVRKGHLVRIERVIRTNLSNRDLTPEMIAAECKISTSYLHQLFRSNGTSVGQWIREMRLIACDQDLRNPNRRDGIAEIAYRWGFSDHAQFCRHFKARFGRTPREIRTTKLPS